MGNQTLTHQITLSKGDVAGLTNLRTAVAKLSSKALRISGNISNNEQITLQDALELALIFDDSLELSANFWREIDFINKLQRAS